MPPRGLALPLIALALFALGCAPTAPATPAPTAPMSPPPAASPPPPPAAAACSAGSVVAGECPARNGVSEVEGWVIAVHACPPCPPRAMCKPCEGEYVVISDTRDDRDADLPVGSHLRVDLPSPPTLKVGQRARLRVIPGPVMFLGDPCCTPGRYRARLAPP